MTQRLRSKLVSVGIGVGMVLVFAACGGGSDPSEPAASGSGSVATSPDAPTGEIDGLFLIEEKEIWNSRSLFLVSRKAVHI